MMCLRQLVELSIGCLHDTFKINVDRAGSVHDVEGRHSVGVVIQNSHGRFMAALTKAVLCTYNSLTIELLAIKKAIEFGLLNG